VDATLNTHSGPFNWPDLYRLRSGGLDANERGANKRIIEVYKQLGIDAETLGRINNESNPTVLPEGQINIKRFFYELEETKGIDHRTKVISYVYPKYQ